MITRHTLRRITLTVIKIRRVLRIFFALSLKQELSDDTASIVARYLGKDIKIVNNDMPTDGIPPISQIEGIDLVTEGMITLNRVLEYARDYADKNSDYFNWNYKNDGASLLSSLLLEEATDINFFIGCAVNAAHQANSSLSISLKMKLMDELAEVLKKVNKTVNVMYY